MATRDERKLRLSGRSPDNSRRGGQGESRGVDGVAVDFHGGLVEAGEEERLITAGDDRQGRSGDISRWHVVRVEGPQGHAEALQVWVSPQSRRANPVPVTIFLRFTATFPSSRVTIQFQLAMIGTSDTYHNVMEVIL